VRDWDGTFWGVFLGLVLPLALALGVFVWRLLFVAGGR
jgi:hypothetical protein